MSAPYTTKIREKKKKAALESLAKGSSINQACKAAQIDKTTLWRWRKKSKKFNDKVLTILDSRTQTVEDALYKAAIDGDVKAQIFWLKNRGYDRWRDRYEQNLGGNLNFKIISAVPRPEEMKKEK